MAAPQSQFRTRLQLLKQIFSKNPQPPQEFEGHERVPGQLKIRYGEKRGRDVLKRQSLPSFQGQDVKESKRQSLHSLQAQDTKELKRQSQHNFSFEHFDDNGQRRSIAEVDFGLQSTFKTRYSATRDTRRDGFCKTRPESRFAQIRPLSTSGSRPRSQTHILPTTTEAYFDAVESQYHLPTRVGSFEGQNQGKKRGDEQEERIDSGISISSDSGSPKADARVSQEMTYALNHESRRALDPLKMLSAATTTSRRYARYKREAPKAEFFGSQEIDFETEDRERRFEDEQQKLGAFCAIMADDGISTSTPTEAEEPRSSRWKKRLSLLRHPSQILSKDVVPKPEPRVPTPPFYRRGNGPPVSEKIMGPRKNLDWTGRQISICAKEENADTLRWKQQRPHEVESIEILQMKERHRRSTGNYSMRNSKVGHTSRPLSCVSETGVYDFANSIRMSPQDTRVATPDNGMYENWMNQRYYETLMGNRAARKSNVSLGHVSGKTSGGGSIGEEVVRPVHRMVLSDGASGSRRSIDSKYAGDTNPSSSGSSGQPAQASYRPSPSPSNSFHERQQHRRYSTQDIPPVPPVPQYCRAPTAHYQAHVVNTERKGRPYKQSNMPPSFEYAHLSNSSRRLCGPSIVLPPQMIDVPPEFAHLAQLPTPQYFRKYSSSSGPVPGSGST